jgi:Pyruvate/2-oxoacid:ferredoxin oxidoreductase delta subunit
MCEFCVKHGDGNKWYLTMKNYSQELLEEEDRINYMVDFANGFEERVPKSMTRLEKISKQPVLVTLARPFIERSQKQDHFGQVVLMEEVEQILTRMDGIARLPCVCRRVTTGEKNARYCYALTGDPRLANELDDSFNLEYLSPTEAIEAVRKLDQEGMVHSVWTFKTPFIGALCNCDQDCIAYRICHSGGYFQVFFKGETVAQVDLDSCNGCKNCMRLCQFGAIRYSSVNKKVFIDPRQCYGCGVCRGSCKKDAITMLARENVPVAAGVW